MTDSDKIDEIDRLLGEYVERINSGEILDKRLIAEEHPELAQELIPKLEFFLDLAPREEGTRELGTVGDYRLERQIARGGMGVVYEAWQHSMDRRVALKVLPAAFAADTRAVARFLQEARIAGNLRHPNVVPVFGMGVEDGVPYYSMEYVEGESLSVALERQTDARGGDRETIFAEFVRQLERGIRGKQNEQAEATQAEDVPLHADNDLPNAETTIDRRQASRVIANAFASVADGLEHAHEQGVIHRDVKPSNILLDTGGRLRIVDFGLARIEGQEGLTLSADIVGTPLYMSPEQARRRKVKVDHRADIYSLGATLYETLTLQPPIRGVDPTDTLSRILWENPKAPRLIDPRIPRDLEMIVLECLRKDASQRYASAADLARDLRNFATGKPVNARPEPPWRRLARRVARHKGAVFTTLAIVAVIIGVVAGRSLRDAPKMTPDSYDSLIHNARKVLKNAWYVARMIDTRDLLRDKEPSLADTSSEIRMQHLTGSLEDALRAFPERPDAYSLYGKTRLLVGDLRQARESFERAQSLSSRDEKLPALLERLEALEKTEATQPEPDFPWRWTTYIGGSGADEASDVAWFPDGDIAIVGCTESLDFPVTKGGRPCAGSGDAFLMRLDPTGTRIVFASCLGGGRFDVATSVAIDARGRAVITGFTDSPDFPATSAAYDATYNGRRDAFVACIDPNPIQSKEETLVFSMFFGGENEDIGSSIELEPDGSLVITGSTASPDFPVTAGAIQEKFIPQIAGFAARLKIDDAAGDTPKLHYSTFLGGPQVSSVQFMFVRETGMNLSIAPDGDWVISLRATPKSLAQNLGRVGIENLGRNDATILKVRADPSLPPDRQLQKFIVVGHSGNDGVLGMWLDSEGSSAIIAGWTWSKDFPVSENAWQTSLAGENDAYALRLSLANDGHSQPGWATFFGGIHRDLISDVAELSTGEIVAVGEMSSIEFLPPPITQAAKYKDTRRGMLLVFDQSQESQDQLVWMDLYESAWATSSMSLAIDPTGKRLAVVGISSIGLRTSRGALAENYLGGLYDGFVAVYDVDQLIQGGARR